VPLAIKHLTRNRSGRKGVGLYTSGQMKNTSAFNYLAQVIVGTIVTSLGGLVFFHEISVRGEDTLRDGTAGANTWGLISSAAIAVIGVFMAHAGVIFWVRRLIVRATSAHTSRKSNKRSAS
jgi:hypothetical protein